MKSTPNLLKWMGLLKVNTLVSKRVEFLAGFILILLFSFLPFFTRSGLGIVMASLGLLWILWSMITPPVLLDEISLWLLLFLGVALLGTGFSPIPSEAIKGLIKLLSYLSIYALINKLLTYNPIWWDRIVGGILVGGLVNSVIALRQLYTSLNEIANWADPNSITIGTIRIYGSLGNPNLMAGYLVPIIPIACIALIRWEGIGKRLFCSATLIICTLANLFTYSRGGWIGMCAALGITIILVSMRTVREWSPILRRLIPLIIVLFSTSALIIVTYKVEPIRTRLTSILNWRGDSSNNFRINVWLASIKIVKDYPWVGIGPGNAIFNKIYPLYQQPKFNALSAYSVPLEILVETGIIGFLTSLGLLVSTCRKGLIGLCLNDQFSFLAIASIASISGLIVHGFTDTIFFRPEVQLIGWFCLASLTHLPHKT